MPVLFSLRSHVLPDAKALAWKLTLLSDIAFAGATEKTMAIAPDIMEKLLVELCRFLIEVADLACEVAPVRTPEVAAQKAACATAAMDTVRQAIALRDREMAREPLRQVAARLGIAFDEEDPDWQRLAFRALRAMLDVQEENARRDQGVFDGPSAAFRSSQDADWGSVHARPQTVVTAPPASPVSRGFAAAPRDSGEESPRGADLRPAEREIAYLSEDQGDGSAPTSRATENTAHSSEADISSLLLEEYFDLYIAKKVEGYTDDFGEEEVPDERSRKSSKNNMEVGKRLWVDCSANGPSARFPTETCAKQRRSCGVFAKCTRKAATRPGISTG